jgi:hypothetical protein
MSEPITDKNASDRLRPHPLTQGSILVTAELARYCAELIDRLQKEENK